MTAGEVINVGKAAFLQRDAMEVFGIEGGHGPQVVKFLPEGGSP